MSLLNTLNEDIKVAMKARDRETLTTLRMIKSSLQNEGIKVGRELTEDEELTVLAREVKQRRDSIHEFSKADREDLVTKVKAELKVVEKYLPAQLTESDIRELVSKAITESGATSMKEFGKVMGLVMPQVKGKADGGMVNSIVKELLS
ncbi:GatB/YqeY domain-containing protein [Vagococcus elongatus]|uniref:Aspartyl-tRNA amidotransferase n=1 Tax=Vagococcus elongatus TaxID=180344 RepID=A0A430AP15_9ENTE|nr:GatB/YqeY domain-containing protein [Vagococcus elongatus]RSU09713.1 aspartyl-tRNA amidotransferase [Vagococcus elongatus]